MLKGRHQGCDAVVNIKINMGGTGTKTAFTLVQYSSASKQSLVAAFTSCPTLPTLGGFW